jgi:hypothetical protein
MLSAPIKASNPERRISDSGCSLTLASTRPTSWRCKVRCSCCSASSHRQVEDHRHQEGADEDDAVLQAEVAQPHELVPLAHVPGHEEQDAGQRRQRHARGQRRCGQHDDEHGGRVHGAGMGLVAPARTLVTVRAMVPVAGMPAPTSRQNWWPVQPRRASIRRGRKRCRSMPGERTRVALQRRRAALASAAGRTRFGAAASAGSLPLGT